jgi:hypothetical protein
VIESGEILLPGKVRMKSIGLPKNIAFACLAETIVLALEGKFENFTVGRNIEWEKVREIYRLGLKHGMRLAAISGVNGVFSDADIRRVRRLALAARAAQARAAEAPKPARRKAATKPPAGASTKAPAPHQPAAERRAASGAKAAKRVGKPATTTPAGAGAKPRPAARKTGRVAKTPAAV